MNALRKERIGMFTQIHNELQIKDKKRILKTIEILIKEPYDN